MDARMVIDLNMLRVMREAEDLAECLQAERSPSAAQVEILDGWDAAPPWLGP
jgi:hypothetical protein